MVRALVLVAQIYIFLIDSASRPIRKTNKNHLTEISMGCAPRPSHRVSVWVRVLEQNASAPFRFQQTAKDGSDGMAKRLFFGYIH